MQSASKSKSLPPPVGGWNTRDALADMPVEDAIVLDNWFPTTDKITVRRGITSHATGMSGLVETLVEYTPLTGTSKLFAVNDGNIYDVSSSGAVGAAVVTGLSNDRFQQVQIGTSGGQFVFICNGADTPRTYNGSSWANSTISGPTIANLVWCNLHQRRLWVGEVNSLTAYYGGTNAIGGTFSSFSLAGIAKLGGYIMAMGTWTRDAGDGQDDVAVFITSEGEAIVYNGTNPSSASMWSLVGVFRIGRPIGRRCMIKAGGDLIIVTQDGFIPMSAALVRDRSQTEIIALSQKINKAVNDQVRDNGDRFGWQPFLYPKGTQLIFNIPQGNDEFNQFVFNTITGSACRFTGINAACWAMKGNEAYIGGNGVVYKYDDGNSDAGTNIEWDGLQAFSYFDTPQTVKGFKRVEPIFQSDGNPSAAVELNLDFQIKTFEGVTVESPTTAALWGIAKWGIGLWGSADQVYRGWRGVRGYGRAAAIRIRGATTSARPSWISTNFTYTPGGQL